MQDQGGSETHRRKPFGRAGKIGIGCAVVLVWLVPAYLAFQAGFRQSWPLAVERVIRGERVSVSSDYFEEKLRGIQAFRWTSGYERMGLLEKWKHWPISISPEVCGTYRHLEHFGDTSTSQMVRLARDIVEGQGVFEWIVLSNGETLPRKLKEGEFAFEVTLGSPSDYRPTPKSPKARYTILLDGRDCLVAIAKHKLP